MKQDDKTNEQHINSSADATKSPEPNVRYVNGVRVVTASKGQAITIGIHHSPSQQQKEQEPNATQSNRRTRMSDG